MAQAMKGVAKALTKMNQKINLPGLQKIMAEFMKENEKSELTQEMMGDTIDDALEDEGTAEEEGMIINQVLDELGVNVGEIAPAAPTASLAKPEAAGADPIAGKLNLKVFLIFSIVKYDILNHCRFCHF